MENKDTLDLKIKELKDKLILSEERANKHGKNLRSFHVKALVYQLNELSQLQMARQAICKHNMILNNNLDFPFQHHCLECGFTIYPITNAIHQSDLALGMEVILMSDLIKINPDKLVTIITNAYQSFNGTKKEFKDFVLNTYKNEEVIAPSVDVMNIVYNYIKVLSRFSNPTYELNDFLKGKKTITLRKHPELIISSDILKKLIHQHMPEVYVDAQTKDEIDNEPRRYLKVKVLTNDKNR